MSGPVVAFRSDGSASLGLGHIRRCMTLALELQNQGAEVHFAVNDDPVVDGYMHKHGWERVAVGEKEDQALQQTMQHVARWGAQVLVLDSYAVRLNGLKQASRPFLAVIDDLADRFWPVDLIVNGAANAHVLAYRTLPHTRLLLGPAYVLLREEFSQEPNHLIRKHVKRVLITVGGMDRLALTPRLVHWTREDLETADIDVVVGPFFSPEIVFELELLAQRDPLIALHKDPPKIRELMLACDLAITGGGQTTYELAATGTPAVAIRLADNQTGNLRGLAAKGSLVWVGDGRDDNLKDQVIQASRKLACDRDRRNGMSRSGRVLVDGLGAKRVAQAIFEACGT